MDPEMDDDWYARYDAACARRQDANNRVSELCTLLAEARLEQQQSNEQVQEIFRERIDLREGLKNE